MKLKHKVLEKELKMISTKKNLEDANIVNEATITPDKEGIGWVTEILGTPPRDSSDVNSPFFPKARGRNVKN